MTDAREFLGRGWAFPVALDDNGRIAVVEAARDIEQAVELVLYCAPGERMREFGAGLDEFVFAPMNTTTLSLIRHRVEQALIRWEARVDDVRVHVGVADTARGRLDIHVDCRVRDSNTFYNLVYPFYLLEGDGP